MKCYSRLVGVIIVEISYGGSMAYGRLLGVTLVVCNKSSVLTKNCYLFESSMYEAISNYLY